MRDHDRPERQSQRAVQYGYALTYTCPPNTVAGTIAHWESQHDTNWNTCTKQHSYERLPVAHEDR